MTHPIPRVTCTLLLGLVVSGIALADPPATAPAGPTEEYKIVGPYVCNNLTAFVILGPDKAAGRRYVTLQEALDRKIITVYETGNVNQLAIENTSADLEVFVQSGDIVKGGRQDRTIALDFVCPPKAKLPVDAFCVEAGRWHGRAGEPTTQFASSNYQLAGNALKVAAKEANDQREVWRQVELLQRKASENAGVNVQAAQSASSLQLSLENKQLGEMTDAYAKALADVPADKSDAVGCAFAVNGTIRSVDVYSSHELFAKLWGKLLRAAAVEAVADRQKGKIFETPRADAVKACMADAEQGKSSSKTVTDRVQVISRETGANVVYETRDRTESSTAGANAHGWIHRNYLAKDEETKAVLQAAERQGAGGGRQQHNP